MFLSDLSAYLKSTLALEDPANLLPVARRLGVDEGSLRGVTASWQSDNDQIQVIQSVWREKHKEEDPSKLKEHLKDFPSERRPPTPFYNK